MTRILTILAIILGVLHAVGYSMPRALDGSCDKICGSHTPRIVETASPCCGLAEAAQPIQDDFCPMSNGPCQCGLRPIDDHRPIDPAPLPQRDRDAPQMVRGPPMIERLLVTHTPNQITDATLERVLRSGFSHNQIQAFLGVWRR